jgi:hypothetical protein
MRKTAEQIETLKAAKTKGDGSPGTSTVSKRGNAERIAPWRWQPGQSGNPGGRRKSDAARALCRAIIESNSEAIYKSLTRSILQGSAYTFSVVSDRGFGKLKDSLELTDQCDVRALTDEELNSELEAIIRKLAGDPEMAERLKKILPGEKPNE